jgi:toxin ParE1/3/4
MKVRFSQSALRELDEILAYLFERSPQVSSAVATRIQELTAVLAEFPALGHYTDEPGVRIVPLIRYPLLVFYTISENELVILNIRHSSRERP